MSSYISLVQKVCERKINLETKTSICEFVLHSCLLIQTLGENEIILDLKTLTNNLNSLQFFVLFEIIFSDFVYVTKGYRGEGYSFNIV